MDAPSWAACGIACLAVAAASFLLLLLSGHFRRRKLKLPPGPKPWPIIGNLNLIGPLLHRSLHDLSRIYGPIMKLQVGSYDMVVCSSADMAKAFLKTHDAVFAYRPRNAAGKYTAYNYSGMTWSPYGPYFQQARKIFLAQLFSAARLQSFEYIRVEEMRVFTRNIFEAKGQSINLKDHLSDLNLNAVCRMVLGKKYTDKSESSNIVSAEEFRKMVDELFLLTGVLNLGDFIPLLDFLDLQVGYIKRMKAVNKKFDRFLEHVLGEHEARRVGVKGYEAKDMVDVLLQHVDDPNLEVKIERHGVKALTQELIAGGTEGSAASVEWAMRMCPGYNLGLRMIQTSLANLIHGFTWKLPENMTREDLNMEEVSGLSTPKKIPLIAVAESRLPLHLY
ncbi:hypothetical protein NL676_028453 [Syzygium grande]|nr:hypothetical protein NL676_028453 [Syzygium grande]